MKQIFSDPEGAIRALQQQRVEFIEHQLRLNWDRGAASVQLQTFPGNSPDKLAGELGVTLETLWDCQRFAQTYLETDIPTLARQELTMGCIAVLTLIEDADRRREMQESLVRGEISVEQLRRELQAEQTRAQNLKHKLMEERWEEAQFQRWKENPRGCVEQRMHALCLDFIDYSRELVNAKAIIQMYDSELYRLSFESRYQFAAHVQAATQMALAFCVSLKESANRLGEWGLKHIPSLELPAYVHRQLSVSTRKHWIVATAMKNVGGTSSSARAGLSGRGVRYKDLDELAKRTIKLQRQVFWCESGMNRLDLDGAAFTNAEKIQRLIMAQHCIEAETHSFLEVVTGLPQFEPQLE